MKRPTMKDVAKLANVTPAVVSRYINKDASLMIKQETRKKIQMAIDELDYRPNSIARSLRLKKSNTIAILIPDISNPFFSGIIKGVQEKAADKKVSVILCETNENEELEAEDIKMLYDKAIDGILVASTLENDKNIQLMKELRIKFALINRTSSEKDTPFVRFDNYEGACLAMEYLIKNGHRKIAHISGLKNTATGQERSQAYYDIMEKYQLETPRDYSVETKFIEEQGFNAAKKFLALKDRPTAIFCCNDMTAIGAYKAVIERGLSIRKIFR